MVNSELDNLVLPSIAASQAESANGPRSVHRALLVLTHVVEHGPQTLSMLARSVELPASTVLRLLRALEEWGFVAKDDEGQYEMGARFANTRLASQPVLPPSLVDLSVPILTELMKLTGESSYLSVPGPAQSYLYLREVQSDQPIRHVGLSGWAGRFVPMEGSAVGHALRGEVPAGDYSALQAVITKDATVIAAPVRDRSGEIVGALSIVGPSFRLSGASEAECGRIVVEAAARLETQLSEATPVA